jgi:hypothetical protein
LDTCTPILNQCAPSGFVRKFLKHELTTMVVAWQPPWTK